MDTITHDRRCERRPGGEYEGMGVPCHCPARAGSPTPTPAPTLVRLNLQGGLAVTPGEVPGSRLTLGELLGDLQDAIERHGEDAELVTFQTNETGAVWGRISYNPFDRTDAPEEFL